MEIERKFLISRVPFQLEFVNEYMVNQNYLSISPEVRIRKKIDKNGNIECFLTNKSEGDLIRDEKELKISKELYDILHNAVLGEDIIKNTYVFKLEDKIVECSVVDFNRSTKFMYVEVEFNSKADAENFIPPIYFGKETTYDKKYKIKNYFCATRLSNISSFLRKK